MTAQSVATPPLLLDEVLPRFQFTRLETIAVAADAPAVFSAARELDLNSIHSPLFDMVVQARGLAGRMLHRAPPRLPSLRVGDLFDAPAEVGRPWVGLAEAPGRELVFGAVGKVWKPVIEWLPVTREQFTPFDEPRWAKIASALVVHPYGRRRSLLTYEARTMGTDPDAAARFARYWALVSPGVGLVLRETLRTVRTAAEGHPRPGARFADR